MLGRLRSAHPERRHVGKNGHDGYHGKHSARSLRMEKHGQAKRDPWQLGRRAVKQAGYKTADIYATRARGSTEAHAQVKKLPSVSSWEA